MDVEAEQRAKVIAEARSWIGTPYHNCADLKGVGVDCGMLLVRVFVDTGVTAPFDPRPYAPGWHMHHSEERYLGFITDRCAETFEPKPGDIVLFKFGRCYSHGGIIVSDTPVRIVHAIGAGGKAGAVTEEIVSRNVALHKASREPRYFSYWG